MLHIHDIWNATPLRRWENSEMTPRFEGYIAELPIPEEEKAQLADFIRFQLVGERSRWTYIPEWGDMAEFAGRAEAFQAGAESALDDLAGQITPVVDAAGATFDAVLTTTATGNLMPGLSYRLAHRLGGLVRPDSLMVDLGNVGCTGSLKAVNLARSLDESFRNILVVAVEIPSTLADMTGTTYDVWQGNCTFGDGAAAAWLSRDAEAGGTALALEELCYRQRSETGLDLIRWGYRRYYGFALADQTTFDRDVRAHVTEVLSEAEAGWKDEPRWAIHPAGILLLMKISRRLGIPGDSIRPSTDHYREWSNQSSVSVLQILRSVAQGASPGEAVNMLSMGAGFNVVYGRVRKVR